MATASLTLKPNAPNAVPLEVIVQGATYGPAIWVAEGVDGLRLPVVVKDETFAESPDTEGGKRVRSREQIPEGGGKVYLSADTDSAFNALLDNWQKTIYAMSRYGGTIAYDPPASGILVTYEVESIEFTSLPQDVVLIAQRLAESEWTFKSTPYGLLAPLTNYNLTDSDPFNRDTITEGRWTVETGAGTISVSGGQLVPSSTAIKQLYRRAVKVDDMLTTFKVVTGSVVTSLVEAVILRLDVDDLLELRFVQTSPELRITKMDNGTETDLVTSTVPTVSTNTSYWIQGSKVGNVLTAKVYTSDPRADPMAVPVDTITHTLAGADATKFGDGVFMNPGLRLRPGDTVERVDDWRLDAPEIRGADLLLDFEIRNIPGSASARPRVRVRDLGGNRVGNPGFEIDTSGWSTTSPTFFLNSGATLTRVTSQFYSGVASGQVVTTAATAFQGIANLMSGTFFAGATYTAEVWVKGNAGGEPLEMFFGDNSANSVFVGFTGTTSWQRVYLSWTPTVDVSDAVVGVRDTTAAIRTFFVDDVVVPGFDRLHAEWGIEDRHYDALNPWPLKFDSDQMVTTGFAGTQTTRTGAHDPNASGNNVIRATLFSVPIVVCSSGIQKHVGTFKHKVRVYATGTGPVYVRLVWKLGSAAKFQENDWIKVPTFDKFYELDLGFMRIDEAVLGTQTCEWRYEAYTIGGSGVDTLDIDVDQLIPVPAGKARISQSETATGLSGPRNTGTVANDTSFGSGVWAPSAGTLTSAVSASGGDYAAVLAPPGGSNYLKATNFGFTLASTVTVVGIQFEIARRGFTVPIQDKRVRLVKAGTIQTEDRASLDFWPGPGLITFEYKTYGGASDLWNDTWVFSDINDTGFGIVISAYDFDGGIGEEAHIDHIRCTVYFTAAPTFGRVLYAMRSMEIRSDKVIREHTSGEWGRLTTTGAYMKPVPAGREGRVSRVAVKARRNDIDLLTDDQIADEIAVSIPELTPRVALLG